MTRFFKGSVWEVVSLFAAIVGLVGAFVYSNRTEMHRLFVEALGRQANLVVVASYDIGPMRTPWNYLAQGGEDLKSDMFMLVSNKLRGVVPRAIRIDHIFDGYDLVKRGDDGGLVFDWRRLDEAVRSILQTGAIPTFSLSYMPPAISSGDVVDKPRDWSEWALVVQRTIEHYSGDLGINDVVYEVWNEPDLFGGWKPNGEKDYLELYRWAAIGAQRAAVRQKFEIGGPGTTGAYPNWMREFMGFVVQNDLRLDFLSWHRYDTDLGVYQYDIAAVLGTLADYPKLLSRGVKLYITESAPTSENNPVNDGMQAAAHLVAASRTVVEDVARLYSFEAVDGKDPAGSEYWGRWGLLTHPDFGAREKPRYRAMQMLNNLSGRRLAVFGEGTWVKAIASRRDDGSIVLVVADYDPYAKHVEETPLTIEGLEAGSYRLRTKLLGGGEVNKQVTVDNSGTLRTRLVLPTSGVMLAEIEKQVD